ncbi:pentatricopeptide repeat-containing protein DOT4, chloroplastic [Selaginella moellendorffii]|nr:pentatricopeptide repeat-containing protein DOT4, chloroplastic [Selaginella moellendorffii]|eukprot:XP_024528255.1 pentatricopeptide repeat-containing protein DOT4, chloroplastic [Selaginella moellendorffii]
MDLEGVKPKRLAFLRVIGACCDARDATEGRKVHARVLEDAVLASDVFLSAALINMYGKCGCLDKAEMVFGSIASKDDFSWTSMIRAYVEHEEFDLALEIYMEFLVEGGKPDASTFKNILRACTRLEEKSLPQGRLVHSQILESGLGSNLALVNRLVYLYGSSGCFEEAMDLLDRMNPPEDVPWNAMVAALSQRGKNRQALELFNRTSLEGVKPSGVTFVSGIDACSDGGDEQQGRAIHARALEAGFGSDEVVTGCLINMYGKCGNLEQARRMLEASGWNNLVSCTSLIWAYCQHGLLENALDVFHRVEQGGIKANKVTLVSVVAAFWSSDFLDRGRAMHARLIELGHSSDVIVTNALIGMYGKCGSLPDAKMIFANARRKNAVSWNSIIGACSQQGDGKSALDLFARMDLSGSSPTTITLANVLEACVRINDLPRGKVIHLEIRGSMLEHDPNVRSSLLNMYTKCGSLVDAEKIFQRWQSSCVVTWTSMIAAYAKHARFEDSLKLGRRMEMEGVKFNEVTFLTVIFACSHAGFVEQGCHYFVSMTRERGMTPSLEQYSCVVDLLARAGWIEQALDFIERRMHLPPNAATWIALLNACKIHHDLQRAVMVAERIIELSPGNSSACSLLQDVCNEAGITQSDILAS